MKDVRFQMVICAIASLPPWKWNISYDKSQGTLSMFNLKNQLSLLRSFWMDWKWPSIERAWGSSSWWNFCRFGVLGHWPIWQTAWPWLMFADISTSLDFVNPTGPEICNTKLLNQCLSSPTHLVLVTGVLLAGEFLTEPILVGGFALGGVVTFFWPFFPPRVLTPEQTTTGIPDTGFTGEVISLGILDLLGVFGVWIGDVGGEKPWSLPLNISQRCWSFLNLFPFNGLPSSLVSLSNDSGWIEGIFSSELLSPSSSTLKNNFHHHWKSVL